MAGWITDRRRGACQHSWGEGDVTSGLRRQCCAECGDIKISFEAPSIPGQLFQAGREADRVGLAGKAT